MVRRPDAEEPSAIRDGKLSFDQLLGQATELRARIEAAARSSILPEDLDRGEVDRLVLKFVEEALGH